MVERPLVTVGGLVVAPDGTILLVQSKKWHDLFSVPGGKVEYGETREAAFHREIWEETHLKVTNLRFALIQECIFSSEFWQTHHFLMNDYIAELDPSYSKEQVELNDEAHAFCWIAPHEALNLPLHHECRLLIEWYIDHVQKQKPPSMGMIGFSGHQISCIIGIYPIEREKEQLIKVDLKIKVDFSKCLASGLFHDTVDYVQLAQLCTKLATEKKYLLLETFAADILDQCLELFGAQWAWVRIQKPSAIATADFAFIELEKSCKE